MLWDRALGYHYMTLEKVSYFNEVTPIYYLNMIIKQKIHGTISITISQQLDFKISNIEMSSDG